MNKLISALILSAFATVSFNALAGSHAGGAPAGKASGPMAAASAPMMKDKAAPAKAAKAATPASAASATMKK